MQLRQKKGHEISVPMGYVIKNKIMNVTILIRETVIRTKHVGHVPKIKNKPRKLKKPI